MYLGEVALLLVFQHHACGTVGFVADNQIHFPFVLVDGFLHHIDALIGGEDDGTVVFLMVFTQLTDNLSDIRRCRYSQIHHAGILIVGILHLACNFCIRADADGSHIICLVGHPGVQRLAQQGDAGDEEENEAILRSHLLHDFQGGESFSCATSHNEFSALVAFRYIVFVGFRHCLQLMTERLLSWQLGFLAIETFLQLVPIDRRNLQVIE